MSAAKRPRVSPKEILDLPSDAIYSIMLWLPMADVVRSASVCKAFHKGCEAAHPIFSDWCKFVGVARALFEESAVARTLKNDPSVYGRVIVPALCRAEIVAAQAAVSARTAEIFGESDPGEYGCRTCLKTKEYRCGRCSAIFCVACAAGRTCTRCLVTWCEACSYDEDQRSLLCGDCGGFTCNACRDRVIWGVGYDGHDLCIYCVSIRAGIARIYNDH